MENRRIQDRRSIVFDKLTWAGFAKLGCFRANSYPAAVNLAVKPGFGECL